MEQKLSQFIGKNVRERLASVLLMLKETYQLEGQKSEAIAINTLFRNIIEMPPKIISLTKFVERQI